MNLLRQNWRTNLVAFLILACMITAMLCVLLGKATLEQAANFIIMVEPILSSIGFFLSKDLRS